MRGLNQGFYATIFLGDTALVNGRVAACWTANPDVSEPFAFRSIELKSSQMALFRIQIAVYDVLDICAISTIRRRPSKTASRTLS